MRRVGRGQRDRLALLRQAPAEAPRLHDARVQIEVMRHHGGAENAERQIQHVRVLHDLDGRREAADHLAPIGIGHGDLDAEADGDDQQHGDDEGLDPAEAERLHPQNQKHVERGQQHADLERNAEQEIEPDGRADHLGEIGGADGELGKRPQRPSHPTRESVAAGLRQVAPRGDAEPHAQRLQQNGHQVRQERDGKQRVTEFRPAGKRGRPVARVHIADGDEIAGAEKGQQLHPEGAGGARLDGAENFGERRRARRAPPALVDRYLRALPTRARRAARLRLCPELPTHALPSWRRRAGALLREDPPLKRDRHMLYVSYMRIICKCN